MNYKAKENSGVTWIEITTHIKCLIVTIDDKNKLYEFKEADKMCRDLSVYLESSQIKHMKEWIEVNCSKVKFTKKSEVENQLSLF